jgi:SNF2 family DNA or RNA helicase
MASNDHIKRVHKPPQLSAHQAEGVQWMMSREAQVPSAGQGRGGILADDMGVGKTHQVCNLIHKHPIQGGTLIITHLATLL